MVLWARPFDSTSAGAFTWHLAQSALVRATVGFAGATVGVTVGVTVGAAVVAAGLAAGLATGSAATATDASRSRADTNDTIFLILSPLF